MEVFVRILYWLPIFADDPILQLCTTEEHREKLLVLNSTLLQNDSSFPFHDKLVNLQLRLQLDSNLDSYLTETNHPSTAISYICLSPSIDIFFCLNCIGFSLFLVTLLLTFGWILGRKIRRREFNVTRGQPGHWIGSIHFDTLRNTLEASAIHARRGEQNNWLEAVISILSHQMPFLIALRTETKTLSESGQRGQIIKAAFKLKICKFQSRQILLWVKSVRVCFAIKALLSNKITFKAAPRTCSNQYIKMN